MRGATQKEMRIIRKSSVPLCPLYIVLPFQCCLRHSSDHRAWFSCKTPEREHLACCGPCSGLAEPFPTTLSTAFLIGIAHAKIEDLPEIFVVGSFSGIFRGSVWLLELQKQRRNCCTTTTASSRTRDHGFPETKRGPQRHLCLQISPPRHRVETVETGEGERIDKTRRQEGRKAAQVSREAGGGPRGYETEGRRASVSSRRWECSDAPRAEADFDSGQEGCPVRGALGGAKGRRQGRQEEEAQVAR